MNNDRDQAPAEQDIHLSLTASEYAELLSKIAKELEIFGVSELDGMASATLKSAFVKLDMACPFDRQTLGELQPVEKIRHQLGHLY
ncbi:hypothetical protein [Pseudomonas sp. S1(2024)]|uniref:hypothetical protein n=1 Tax=Pseudomonas sp. S1(2024) TaxID=3390191 RepID=UPI00397A1F1E